MKKVAIIGTVGIPAKYGGFETLAEYLTLYLAVQYDMTVYCSSKSYKNKLDTYNNAKLEYINLNANGVKSIPYDIISIFKALKSSDTLLILGVSGCIILPVVRLFSKKRIIINIDGLEWKRDKWSKNAKWFLKYSEKLAVKYAYEVVTDNKAIQDYVLQEYGRNSNLIAYGADHVSSVTLADETKKNYPVLNSKYAFTVCRIEPENNIHMILEAFSTIDFPYVLIGNWQSSTYGKELLVKFSGSKNIYLIDPIYDQDILNQFRSNCTLYIHGHSAGGTNPSLVEAMYLRLPIIAFDVIYNRETTENKAQYFEDPVQLVKIIENINNKELTELAETMQKVAKKSYTWEHLAHKYGSLF